MEKIIKKIRHDTYCRMLKEFDDYVEHRYFGRICPGFCSCLLLIYSPYKVTDLPELMAHKPKHAEAYWWGRNIEGRDKRRAILVKVIEQTKPDFIPININCFKQFLNILFNRKSHE